MYAVIELQGFQFQVEKDEKFVVNRLDAEKDETIKVDKVLFGKKGNSYFIGEPYVENAYVECTVIGDKRLKKVIAFKYRDRKSSQSKIGHRQDVTELKVKNIFFEGAGKDEKPETAKKETAVKKDTKEVKDKSKAAEAKKTATKTEKK